MEYAAEVWWTEGHNARKKLESSMTKMGRRLLGESNTVQDFSTGRSWVDDAGENVGRDEGDVL